MYKDKITATGNQVLCIAKQALWWQCARPLLVGSVCFKVAICNKLTNLNHCTVSIVQYEKQQDNWANQSSVYLCIFM